MDGFLLQMPRGRQPKTGDNWYHFRSAELPVQLVEIRMSEARLGSHEVELCFREDDLDHAGWRLVRCFYEQLPGGCGPSGSPAGGAAGHVRPFPEYLVRSRSP